MQTKGLVAVLSVAMALGGTACKKTQEGETRNWEQGTRRAQELAALYPGFAPAIQTQKAMAQTAMDAARAISSPEESARKMSEANSLLTAGFLGSLGEIDGKVRKVREKLSAATATMAGGADTLGAQPVVSDAHRLLVTIDDTLRRGAAEPVGALAVLRRVETDLSDVGRNLDRIVDAAKKRQEMARTPGAVQTPGGESVAGAPKAAAAADWKCAYCGTIQGDAARKCAKCGAPRKGAAK